MYGLYGVVASGTPPSVVGFGGRYGLASRRSTTTCRLYGTFPFIWAAVGRVVMYDIPGCWFAGTELCCAVISATEIIRPALAHCGPPAWSGWNSDAVGWLWFTPFPPLVFGPTTTIPCGALNPAANPRPCGSYWVAGTVPGPPPFGPTLFLLPTCGASVALNEY